VSAAGGPSARGMVPVLALLLLGTLAAAPLQAQDPPGPEAGAGTAAAGPVAEAPRPSAIADTSATTVGGPIRVQLTVETPEGWLADPVQLEPRLGTFGVRNVREIERSSDRRVIVLHLIALESGLAEVPPIAVTLRGPDGEPVEMATDPIPIEVATNLVEPVPEADDGTVAAPVEPDLAPDKPARSAPRDWRPVIIAAVTALVMGVLAFLLLRRLRRRQPREKEASPPRIPARPAWETALEELDRIRAEGLVEKGELRRQYEEVTVALRRYLEDRYGVPALESTTDELRRHLRRGPVPADPSSLALLLLAEADLVKFAKAEPTPAEARGTERRARDVVEATMPRADAGGEERAA